MTRKLQTCLLLTVATVAITFTSVSAAYGQGTWTSLAPVPAATEGMSVGGSGRQIIAAYGFSPGSGDTDLTRLYNIKTNTWGFGLAGPGGPSSEESYGETFEDGFFYVIGGRTGGTPRNDLRRYDPISNTWTVLAPMPTARAGAAAAFIDDALFVIGGRMATGGPCTGPALSVVERYDIKTNTWSTVASLPTHRSDLAAVRHEGKIFVFGGCDGFGNFTNEVDEYRPRIDTWTLRTPMPTRRASLVAGQACGDDVFAIGGFTGGPPLSVNEVFDISDDSWSTAAPMPTPRGEAGVHSHRGRVFVVGGSQPAFGASVNANEVFKPQCKKRHEGDDDDEDRDRDDRDRDNRHRGDRD